MLSSIAQDQSRWSTSAHGPMRAHGVSLPSVLISAVFPLSPPGGRYRLSILSIAGYPAAPPPVCHCPAGRPPYGRPHCSRRHRPRSHAGRGARRRRTGTSRRRRRHADCCRGDGRRGLRRRLSCSRLLRLLWCRRPLQLWWSRRHRWGSRWVRSGGRRRLRRPRRGTALAGPPAAQAPSGRRG